LICGGKTEWLNPVCDECFQKLQRVTPPLDKKTGRPLKSSYFDAQAFTYFVANRAYCVYDDLAAKIVREFKYNGHFRIASSIAKKLVSMIDVQADLVVPVPAPVATMISRGYNQSALIAKKVARYLNYEYCVPIKSKKKSRQVGKSFREQHLNVKNTILPRKKYADKIKGKVVLLIDDVFTTGSTLNETAKVLTFMGAKKVFCFTFAITSKVG